MTTLADEQRATRDELARQELAEFMLGPRGLYVGEEEWDRLADYWHGRAQLSELLITAAIA